tara:strand:+ start:36405 stop:37397 length:993 start_codon:yes stop_codon:yes gene_type:complete
MFVDEVTVALKAGDGGDGCISFRREKYLPKGGPNGGDGGSGGNVLLICDENMGDLTPYRFKGHAKARNGEPGRGRDQYGKNGEDCTLRLPPGTIVYDTASGFKVAELLDHEQEVLLLQGGQGGMGNVHFKSSTNQTPRESTPGKPGESGEFRFVIKTIADIGLVGFPNAGKSTLISCITEARPKTAAYPFTTLNPNVGVIHYEEQHDRLFLADIPGLIEGASENRGLGHRFLRHIERCTVLVFVIDMAAQDGRKPFEDYAQLLEELRLYDPALLEKERLVVANKMDLPAFEENLKAFQEETKVPVIELSCLEEQGLDNLKDQLYQIVRKD